MLDSTLVDALERLARRTDVPRAVLHRLAARGLVLIGRPPSRALKADPLTRRPTLTPQGHAELDRADRTRSRIEFALLAIEHRRETRARACATARKHRHPNLGAPPCPPSPSPTAPP